MKAILPPQNKGDKPKSLWALMDVFDRTIIQIYSDNEPSEMIKYLRNE